MRSRGKGLIIGLVTGLGLGLVGAPAASAITTGYDPGAEILFIPKFGAKDGLYTIRADGTHQTALMIENKKRSFERATWSPDGKKIALQGAFLIEGKKRNRIKGGTFTMRADGTKIKQVDDRRNIGTGLIWTPDNYLWNGKRLIPASGKGKVRKTPSVPDPALSADGQWVLSSSPGEFDQGTGVFLSQFGSTNSTRLSQSGHNGEFSPTEPLIAFSADGSEYGPSTRLWLMNVDGSGQREFPNTPDWAADPDFSPDGQRIVFSQSTGGGVYVINKDGSGLTELTGNGPFSTQPQWRP
jgi:Tol biopolymer transport system component